LTPAELAQIGATIRRIREGRGLTLEELARKSDVSISHLSRIENARRAAHPAIYRRISEALGVQMSTIAPRFDLEGVA
jgi:transcriptional regulator with XRE-family HTH domain